MLSYVLSLVFFAAEIIIKLESNFKFLQLISAADRHRHSTEHPIKFISRRQPHILKFKIKPGKHAMLSSYQNN